MSISSTPDFEACRLIQEGAYALSFVESNGIRIDVDYLHDTYENVDSEIKEATVRLKESPVYGTWFRSFGAKTNLASGKQLSHILFNELGFTATEFTESEQISTDEKHLKTIDHPFVHDYLQVKKLTKLRDTYLKNIMNEVCDGFLHPSFNLNLVETYRSSSSNPNFQNIPIRNKEIARYIRRAFIPRDGHALVEIDYGQIEVRVSACYHQDPTMINYIETNGDMHADMAAELFLLPLSSITKQMRHVAKNSFVFAEFYGDFYPSVTKGIWDALERDKVEYGGKSIFDFLKKKGISSRGECQPKSPPESNSYEAHVKKVEQDFWNVRFPVYRDWKDKWYAAYLKRGWFKTKTGFVGRGVYKRNEVINAPIQGSAFQCMLWSLIQLVKQFRKRKLRSCVVGQIHDSILIDVHLDELDFVSRLAYDIMTQQIREHWSWIIVPLTVDASICHSNWFEKKEHILNV